MFMSAFPDNPLGVVKWDPWRWCCGLLWVHACTFSPLEAVGSWGSYTWKRLEDSGIKVNLTVDLNLNRG